MTKTNRLTRSTSDQMLGGVAGGIAEYFNVEAALIRLAFVGITLLGGSGVVAYLILWVILPTESKNPTTDTEAVIKENTQEIKGKITSLTKDIKTERSHLIWGLILISFGLIFLLQNYGFMIHFNLFRLWPVILIIFGFSILTQSDKS